MRHAAAWLLAIGPLGSALAAQVPRVPAGPVLQWRGELGSYGELYHNSGNTNRRPGETGRLFLNSTATLFGSLTVDVNLLLTTEDGAGSTTGFGGIPGRQQIAQFGLHPQWRWGRGHLGSFSDQYTPLTYSGVRVTGAAFDLNPGLLRVAAFGGQSRSAVLGGAATGSYQRTTVGGRLGVGRRPAPGQPGSYFDVVVMRAWDDVSSLPAPVDTTLPPNSPGGGGAVAANPFAVTPQDNLVVAGVAGLSLLERRLVWRTEFATSVHTLDRRATPLADETLQDYPRLFRSLLTPRIGTHADYAYSTEVQLRVARLPGATPTAPRTLTAALGYKNVGPGYVSLGVGSLPNDLRALTLRTSVRFRRWSLNLDGMRQRDNLLDQKLATTTRYRTGGTFTLQATRAWSATVRGNYLTMGNDLADPLQRTDYAAWTIGTGHTLSLGPRRRVESVSLDYTYQRAGDDNPLRTSSSFLAHTVDLRASVRMNTNLRLIPSVGVASSRADTNARVTRATYGVSGVWRALGGRLTSTTSLSRSRYGRANTLVGTLNGRYQVTSQDALVLTIQTNRFRDVATPVNGFNEYLVSLRWTRQF